MKLVGGLVLALLALPARADTVYDVTGTLTLDGNNVCNGVCLETVNFSFVLNEFQDQFGFYYLSVASSSTHSIGPLDAFSEVGMGSGFWVGFDNGLDDIDLYFADPTDFGSTTPFTPSFGGIHGGIDLYSCGGFMSPLDPTCVADFSNGGYGCCSVGGGTASTTVREVTKGVPEPGLLGMLLLGMALLAVPFWGSATHRFGDVSLKA